MNAFKRYTRLLLCSAGLIAAALAAGCGGGGDQGRDPILGVPAAELQALAVTPLTASVAVGASQQFLATASYTDGSSRDVSTSAAWNSATPALATVNAGTGMAAGVGAGSVLISATFGGKSASATLTVTPAALLSLAVTPQAPTVPLAATRQLVALATYSDGSVVDVSASAVFVSATPATVTSSTSGLATGVAVGTSVVTASFGGQTASTTVTVPNLALTSLSVTPATASVAVGALQQFVATATYADGSTAIISNSASWTSLATGTATVAPGGAATGVTVGSTSISASSGLLTGSALLTVTAAGTPPVVVAPVNLGSASSFAVLAGTALTSASGGTTLITGDVGSPSQTVAPTVAPGYTDYTSGAVLDNALADLQLAITDANSRLCDVAFAGNIDLGGVTLAPGVYCYAGSISITGTLKLSGPGVYIFRTALTLNSTANSTVQLVNGATADNVTWVPVGATTLGANSVFIGTVLGQSAAITVGDNATLLNGRVLSGAAVTLSNNQIAK